MRSRVRRRSRFTRWLVPVLVLDQPVGCWRRGAATGAVAKDFLGPHDLTYGSRTTPGTAPSATADGDAGSVRDIDDHNVLTVTAPQPLATTDGTTIERLGMRRSGTWLRILVCALAGIVTGVTIPAQPAEAVVGGVKVTDLSKTSFIGHYVGWYGFPPLDVFHAKGKGESCGATLISPAIAITAAHCVTDHNISASDMTVSFTRPNGKSASSGVRSFAIEPGSDPHRDINDLAILNLTTTFSDIDLPLIASNCPDWTTRSDMFSIGWGQGGNGANDSGANPLSTPNRAGLKFTPSSPDYSSTNYFLAVNDSGTMQFGDSGSGLFFQRPDGRYELLGALHAFADGAPAWDPAGKVRLNVYERVDVGSVSWSWVQKYALAYAPCLPSAPPPSASPPPPPAPVPAPATPVLHVTGQTTNSISLSWGAVPGATGYRVYEGSTQLAAPVSPTAATSVTIGSLESNTTHTYSVTAYNSSGESAKSTPQSATTLATWTYAVTSQSAVDAGGATADLTHARPGQQFTVTIKARNTGSATWTNSGANPVRMGTAHPQDRISALQTSGWLSATRPAALVESSVPPGGTGTFRFSITAPAAAGTVKEYFNLVAEGITWFTDPGTFVTVTTVPVVGFTIQPGTSLGQWVVAADGGVFAFAGAPFYGSMGGKPLNAPIVGIAPTPSGAGYWLVGSDGGVFAFGDAGFYGSAAGTALARPMVGISPTPSGRGYWLVAADGGVFAYGDAPFFGSMGGKPLNSPVVGIASTPTGRGYWLAGGDGGVFAYGDAVFSGSMAGKPLNGPITSIAGTADGRGYWLAGSDGGVFAFGTASFGGSASGATSIVGIARTGPGYALVARSGDVRAFATNGAPAPRNTLFPGERLNPGEALTSANGRYILVMQGDGNLVEYDAGRPTWASGTNRPGSDFEAQTDGNFVVYAPGHVPVWATGTNRSGATLTLQDDRNVVIYAPGSTAVWASNTAT